MRNPGPSPVWAWTRIGLSIVGLGISFYLTLVHYAHVTLVCPLHGTLIDCAAVVQSPQSIILGVPIAVWGMVWFVLAAVFASLALRADPPSWLRPLTLGWSIVGLLSVLYFLYLELDVIGHLCIWCTTAHVLVLAYFVCAALAPPGPQHAVE